MRSSMRSLFAIASVFSVSHVANGAIVFHDTFENGPAAEISSKGNDTFDASDVSWLSSLSPGALSVVDDAFAGGGSARALQFTSNDSFRRFGANFTSTQLGLAEGDQLVLTFAMKFIVASPATNDFDWRFGLFNSNGTNIATDNPNGISQPAEQNDDFGYHIRVGTGAAAAPDNGIYRETAGNNPLGGAGAAGGTLISTADSAAIALTGLTTYEMKLVLERGAGGAVNFAFSIDDVLKSSGTELAPVTDTFDAIYFGEGNINTGFQVDNVKLEVIPVPEPASTALLALGGLVLVGRRR